MGRTANKTLTAQEILYGGKLNTARAEAPDRYAAHFQTQLEHLRSRNGQVFSCRQDNGVLIEGWVSRADDGRSTAHLIETGPRGSSEREIRMSAPCRKVKLLDYTPEGLTMIWEREDGTCRRSTICMTDWSASTRHMPLGKDLEGHSGSSAFCFYQGDLCSSAISSSQATGDCLETRRERRTTHRISVDPAATLVQGTGADRNLVMALGQSRGYGNIFQVIDMPSGWLLDCVPAGPDVDQASFLRNGDELLVCYTSRMGRLQLASSFRGEMMNVPDVCGETIFRGGLSPLALDLEGNIRLAWPDTDGKGRTRIYGSVIDRQGQRGGSGELSRALIDICEPEVQVESLTVIPGSGEVAWTEYSEGGSRADIRIHPMERAGPDTGFRQTFRENQRVWIDSARGDKSGGELLWRRADADSIEAELLRQKT